MKTGKSRVFLSFACAILFSYAEQTSVVFLVSSIIILIANKKTGMYILYQ
jgi:hypothetical protein